jgi:hypothetical protein
MLSNVVFWVNKLYVSLVSLSPELLQVIEDVQERYE